MNEVTCLYHNNCFDGICSAWVVSRKFPDAKFHPMNYGNMFEDANKENVVIESGSRVIMVDWSMARPDMEYVKNRMQCDLTVLDHHKTAQAACEGLDYCVFDMNESGASLAWKYFFPDEELPKLVRYIKDRDLWLFQEPESESINSFIHSFPMEIREYKRLWQMLESSTGFEQAYQGGISINRYKQTMIETMCKNARMIQILDHVIPVANVTMLFSEVGNRLCQMYPDAPYAAYYLDRGDGIRQWGARSIGNFDVSEIAKVFGGGGHKNAAGWQEPIPRFDNQINELKEPRTGAGSLD